MLVQPFEPKAGRDQAADHVAERVDPIVLSRIREPSVRVRIVARIFGHDRLATEIGCKISRQAARRGRHVIERPDDLRQGRARRRA